MAAGASVMNTGRAATSSLVRTDVVTVDESMTISGQTASSDPSTGALVCAGGAGIGGDLNVGGAVQVDSTVPSSSTSTGALVCDGGVGIAGDVHVGGTLTMNSMESSGLEIASTVSHFLARMEATGDVDLWLRSDVNNVTETDHPALWLTQDGGLVSFRVGTATGTNSLAIDTVGTTSWNTNEALLQIRGGAVTQTQSGDSLPAYSGTPPTVFTFYPDRVVSAGRIVTEDTTASSSTSTGALVCDGGAGIAGDVYVGGEVVSTAALTEETLTFSGPVTSDTATVKLKKGNGVVHVFLPSANFSGNSTPAALSSTAISTDFRPATTTRYYLQVVDGGVPGLGQLVVDTSGVLTFYADAAASSFNTAGTVGFSSTTVSFLAAA